MASRAGVSSADRETSAADEQPAPSDASASRPGAGVSTADGTAPSGADSSATPQKLSRAERKAQYTGQPPASTGSVPADTAAPTAEPAGTVSDDPVAARVAEAVKPLVDRLEGLLKPAEQQTNASAPESPEAQTYRDLFGDDQEYERRREVSERGSLRGQYLDPTESDELALWSSNRKARDFQAGVTNRQYQAQYSAVTLAAAGEFGIPVEKVSAPGTTFRDIYQAFVDHGASQKAAELDAERAAHAQTKTAMQQMADENEALKKRLPASAMSVLRGGASEGARAAALLDRTRMTGRQQMAAGLAQREQSGRRNRPGAR